MRDVIIIGGGLAGLITSIQLAKENFKVLLIEKKAYPFHRVCGEYISNEVVPFLKSIDAYPEAFHPAQISKLIVSAPSGKTLHADLEMGGFGISRFTFDFHLYQIAVASGVEFIQRAQVDDVQENKGSFKIFLSNGEIYEGKLVIGAFGKRSNLDRKLDRSFFFKRSPYIGVKYHIKFLFPSDTIALHNFKDGYCGISQVEDNKYCLCYLTTRENLKVHGSIEALQEKVLSQNPHLKEIFTQAEFLFDKPEAINEISFEKKTIQENDIIMLGDAAGMITPLCGNGMSMAIHSAKILSEIILENFDYKYSQFNLNKIKKDYSSEWRSKFETRLWVGRKIQNLFGKSLLTDLTVSFLRNSPRLVNLLISQTHGREDDWKISKLANE